MLDECTLEHKRTSLCVSDIYSQNHFLSGFQSIQTRPCYQREREREGGGGFKVVFFNKMDSRETAEMVQDPFHSAIFISTNEILIGVQQLISS